MEILERVKAATAARDGENSFERDGIVVGRLEPPFPLIAALLNAALSRGDGSLYVLDVGGSLGSSLKQCRPFLANLGKLCWSIVEQADFVEHGKRHLEDQQLRFFSTMEEAVRNQPPDVVLLSGVLQYLEDPLRVAAKVADLGATSIVIDRVPIVGLRQNRIAIQRVPKRLGKSAYPLWLFNRDSLLAPFAAKYTVISEHSAVDGAMSYGWRRIDFRGFILDRAQERQRA